MNARGLSLPFSILCTAAVVLALATSAFADGSASGPGVPVLGDSRTDFSIPLPATLGDWRDAAADLDLGEPSVISLSQFPQGRLAQKPPFIDFSHWEIGGFAGLADYSSDFKAKADWVLGLDTRIPVPGIPLGDWGVWAQIMVGHIKRDIPFYYPKPESQWYGVAVGGDYTLFTTDLMFLRAQGGVMYADWNNIYALKNGAGVLVGADLGFYWIKHYTKATVDINPQVNFDSKNWVGLYTIGFSYDF
jgi:hypothetical protein